MLPFTYEDSENIDYGLRQYHNVVITRDCFPFKCGDKYSLIFIDFNRGWMQEVRINGSIVQSCKLRLESDAQSQTCR